MRFLDFKLLSLCLLIASVQVAKAQNELEFQTFACKADRISGISEKELFDYLGSYCKLAPRFGSLCSIDPSDIAAKNWTDPGRIEQCDTVFYCNDLQYHVNKSAELSASHWRILSPSDNVVCKGLMLN